MASKEDSSRPCESHGMEARDNDLEEGPSNSRKEDKDAKAESQWMEDRVKIDEEGLSNAREEDQEAKVDAETQGLNLTQLVTKTQTLFNQLAEAFIKEEKQKGEWSQRMEERVKALEEELSNTRKQYEETKADAITKGLKLTQAENDIQTLRDQHDETVAQVKRITREIEDMERKTREGKQTQAYEERDKTGREDREKNEKEEREKKKREDREKKERIKRQLQAYEANEEMGRRTVRFLKETVEEMMCTRCQGWTEHKSYGFNCKCGGRKN